MNLLVTLATTAAILLHTVLGCCAHHAHATEKESHAGRTVAVPCHHQHGGHRHFHFEEPSSDDHTSEESQAPSRDCDESQCAFFNIVSKSTLTDAISCFVAADLAVPPAMTVLKVSPSAGLSYCAQPPIRPHLFHQVMLI